MTHITTVKSSTSKRTVRFDKEEKRYNTTVSIWMDPSPLEVNPIAHVVSVTTTDMIKAAKELLFDLAPELLAWSVVMNHSVNRTVGNESPTTPAVAFKKGDWVVPHSKSPQWAQAPGKLYPTPQQRVINADETNPLQVTIGPDQYGNLTVDGHLYLHVDSARKLENYVPPLAKVGEYVRGNYSLRVYRVVTLTRLDGSWRADLLVQSGETINSLFTASAYRKVDVKVIPEVPATPEQWVVTDR